MTNLSNDQIALQSHIEAQNVKWVAECEERGSTFYTTTVSDAEHWLGYGITTIAQYERHCLVSSIWDAYKELNGFRPRFIDFEAMSMEELTEMESRICSDIQREIEWEEGADAREEERKDTEIGIMMSNGAADRETAERWMQQVH